MQAHSRCTYLPDIQHGWLQTLGQPQVVHPSWAGPGCWLVTPQPPLYMLALHYRPLSWSQAAWRTCPLCTGAVTSWW